MLLRNTEAGPEVFLQRRVKAMAFAPNVTVFPGGGVDERDRVTDPARWLGPSPDWWAKRLGCDVELAAALVCAAVRETFEECGVLLAGAGRDGAQLDGATVSTEQLTAARAELVDRRVSLPDVLAANDWVLRTDLLRPWSNWITPEAEPRRYDTRFFVAELPEGQHADDSTTEVTGAYWRRPVDALDDWHADRIELLPPTWVSLEQLQDLPDTSAALRAGDERIITPLIPKVRRDGDKILLTMPGDLGYDSAPLHLRPRLLPTLKGPATLSGLLPGRTEHPRYETLRQVTATASVVLADNPGQMTLDGTNTWLLRGVDSESVIVVDPGPEDARHLSRIAENGPVALILLTHRHSDHTEGARRLAELTQAPIRALDPSLTHGGEALSDGEVISAAGLEIRVMTTPGHTSDSLSFVMEDAVLTGDTILGRGTTVIDHPDGTIADYLASLRRLIELPDGMAVLPGHGPELADVVVVAKQYLVHREQRLDQVRGALRTLGADASARQVVEHVYADVDESLWPVAEWSVEAQLTYLRRP